MFFGFNLAARGMVVWEREEGELETSSCQPAPCPCLSVHGDTEQTYCPRGHCYSKSNNNSLVSCTQSTETSNQDPY